MSVKTLSTLFAILTLAVTSLSAQPALKGSYALVERGVLSNGQEFVALGTITIDALGHATGTEFLRGAGGSADLPLNGTYNAADKSLVLTYATTNSDGDTVATPLNYRVVGTADTMRAIRTDLGIVSDVQLMALSSTTTALKGQFLLNETNVESSSQSFVSFTTLTLNGGQVTGRTTRKTFGPEAAFDLSGTYTGGIDGTGMLTLQIPSTDGDGNVTYTSATYRFIAVDAKQLLAVRADPGVVTSVEINAAQ